MSNQSGEEMKVLTQMAWHTDPSVSGVTFPHNPIKCTMGVAT